MPTSTIRDVAAHAGVSIASVSRALSGGPGVSEATRRRVLVAVRDLDYRPDQVARSLRRRRANLIGLVVSTIENQFFTQIAYAAEQAALRHGYNLLIGSTDERIDREEASIAVLRQQLVAGIILAPAPGDISQRDYLSVDTLPIVLINRELGDPRFPSVLEADEEGAYRCAKWLIREGRRRIGVIRGLDDVTTTRERIAGYVRALPEANVVRHPELEVPGGATTEGGYQAASDLMIRANPPDAIFVFNNVMLTGAVLALQDLGISWPSEVDIAGFGAFEAARLVRPPLTLIEQPTYAMAERAVALLLDQINGRNTEEPKHFVLPNRLVTRKDWLDQRVERGSWMRFHPPSAPARIGGEERMAAGGD